MIPLLLTPLLRDPLRCRLGRVDAAGIVAGILGVGGASLRHVLAGVDAALTPARPTSQTRRPRATRALPGADRVDITQLIYELLDAHSDTQQIAACLASDPQWKSHLHYLQALQRKGRETLAHAGPQNWR
jgi:hypothetical protein